MFLYMNSIHLDMNLSMYFHMYLHKYLHRMLGKNLNKYLSNPCMYLYMMNSYLCMYLSRNLCRN